MFHVWLDHFIGHPLLKYRWVFSWNCPFCHMWRQQKGCQNVLNVMLSCGCRIKWACSWYATINELFPNTDFLEIKSNGPNKISEALEMILSIPTIFEVGGCHAQYPSNHRQIAMLVFPPSVGLGENRRSGHCCDWAKCTEGWQPLQLVLIWGWCECTCSSWLCKDRFDTFAVCGLLYSSSAASSRQQVDLDLQKMGSTTSCTEKKSGNIMNLKYEANARNILWIRAHVLDKWWLVYCVADPSTTFMSFVFGWRVVDLKH